MEQIERDIKFLENVTGLKRMKLSDLFSWWHQITVDGQAFSVDANGLDRIGKRELTISMRTHDHASKS